MTCPIAGGQAEIRVEFYLNPNAIRRFGHLTFGDDVFGDSGSGAVDWFDYTEWISDIAIDVGSSQPTVDPPASTCDFAIVDPDGDVMGWRPPDAFGSPTVGTPVRITLIAPEPLYLQTATGDDLITEAGQLLYGLDDTTKQETVLFYGRIDTLSELHASPDRRIEVQCASTKSELTTPLYQPDRPRENAQTRIAAVLAEIGWTYGVTYPPDMASYGLEQDPNDQRRQGLDAYAWTIITEAANSAGYVVNDDNTNGGLRFTPLGLTEPLDPFVVADCDRPGVDAVANTITYTADAMRVLNVVILENKYFPTRTRQAQDPASIAQYGRRATGYGFPMTVVNDDTTDTQNVADAYVAATAFIINRVEQFTFDTLNAPVWLLAVAKLTIGSGVEVRQYEPLEQSFTARVSGYRIDIGRNNVAGTIYTSTRSKTL